MESYFCKGLEFIEKDVERWDVVVCEQGVGLHLMLKMTVLSQLDCYNMQPLGSEI